MQHPSIPMDKSRSAAKYKCGGIVTYQHTLPILVHIGPLHEIGISILFTILTVGHHRLAGLVCFR